MLRVHADEEFLVVLCAFETAFQLVHGFDGCHVGEVLAENPHTIQSGLVVKQVVAAGAAGDYVHGGEDALVGQSAVTT